MSTLTPILYNEAGVTIAVLDTILTAAWGRKERQIGTLALTLPASALAATPVQTNQLIDLFVADSGTLIRDGDARWIVRGVRQARDESGRQTITIDAVDGVDLLNRRIIQYNAGTSQTDKTGAADNLIKQFARENCGPDSATTDAARRYPATFWSIAADVSAAPSLSKAATRRNLLTTCQELADASALAGTYLTFDVIWSGSTYLLQTYINQRGTDRRLSSSDPLYISAATGAIGAASLAWTDRDRATAVVAGGQGEGADRAIATALDSAALPLSPFAYIETFQQANMTTDAAALQDEADAALYAARRRETYEATLVMTPSTQWGASINFGDRVSVLDFGQTIDCRIDAYSASYDATNGLTRTIQLRRDR
jgi:hypothetical protein